MRDLLGSDSRNIITACKLKKDFLKAYLGRTSDSIRSRVKKLKKVDIVLLKTKLVEFICTKRELSERNGLRLKEPIITDIQPLSKYNAVIDTSFERELSSIERLMKFRECVIPQDLELCPSILSQNFIFFVWNG